VIAVLPSMIHPKTAVLGRAGGGKFFTHYFFINFIKTISVQFLLDTNV